MSAQNQTQLSANAPIWELLATLLVKVASAISYGLLLAFAMMSTLSVMSLVLPPINKYALINVSKAIYIYVCL